MAYERVECLAYGTHEDLGQGDEVTLVEKTFESNTYITTVICSGDLYAKFSLVINKKFSASKRSGPERNVEFKFPTALFAAAKSKMEVRVIHNRPSSTGDFESGIFGYS